MEARVWNDVELLDQRFGEGDAVHVLGRVERFGGKLQVQVRAVEPAEDTDPSALTPSLRRDADELDGFYEFLASEISHDGLAATVGAFVRDRRSGLPSATFRPRAPTATTATRAACSSTRSASRRSAARPPSSTRASGTTSCSPPRSCTTSGVFRARRRSRVPTNGGRQAARARAPRAADDRGASSGLDPAVLAELLHVVACHHDRPAARTAEAAVLYHANQLDGQAATRPVGDD